MTDAPKMIEREFAAMMTASGLDGCPDLQRTQMRLAFFAGARAYSFIVMAHAEGGDDATDQDMALMEALEAELTAFADSLAEGRGSC